MDNLQHANLIPDPLPDGIAFETRLRRLTIALVVIGITFAGALAGWKMALGVALGGALSLFNERWLRASTRAMIELASATGNPSVATTSKFVLRFLIIAVVVAVALKSGYFHVFGIGIGLAAFVGAAMIEAVYQLITFKD